MFAKHNVRIKKLLLTLGTPQSLFKESPYLMVLLVFVGRYKHDMCDKCDACDTHVLTVQRLHLGRRAVMFLQISQH